MQEVHRDRRLGDILIELEIVTREQLERLLFLQIEEAVYHSAMPEDGSMTNAERIQLGQWLSCGAP